MSNKLVLKNNILVLYKTNNECFYSCNSKNMFIRWKIDCSNRAINLSAHEYILTIALIDIHYLYNIKQNSINLTWHFITNSFVPLLWHSSDNIYTGGGSKKRSHRKKCWLAFNCGFMCIHMASNFSLLAKQDNAIYRNKFQLSWYFPERRILWFWLTNNCPTIFC